MDAPAARELIARRRDELSRRAESTEHRLAGIRAARGEWTDEEHDPEGFALTHEWSQAEGDRTRFAATLRALDEAAARIDEGAYGVCAECGDAIPDAQLERRPERAVCVACAARHARR